MIKAATRKILLIAYRAVERVYVLTFARPSMQRYNDKLLHLALRARGYGDTDPQANGELAFLELLARHEPRVCIDIGANVGRYSESLLRATASRVIAFEPLPASFDALRDLGARFQGRLTAVNQGVGDKVGHLDLHFGSANTELASFAPEANQVGYVSANNKDVVRVAVTTLDSYLRDTPEFRDAPIDFVKIDTEGFEYEVLLGARETICVRRPKFIQLEYNWHHLFRGHTLFAVASLLPGYALYQITPHGSILCPRDSKSLESNIFNYSNFVFVREDVEIIPDPIRPAGEATSPA